MRYCTKVRKTQESSVALEYEIKRLKLIEEDFDRVKERAEQEVFLFASS